PTSVPPQAKPSARWSTLPSSRPPATSNTRTPSTPADDAPPPPGRTGARSDPPPRPLPVRLRQRRARLGVRALRHPPPPRHPARGPGRPRARVRPARPAGRGRPVIADVVSAAQHVIVGAVVWVCAVTAAAALAVAAVVCGVRAAGRARRARRGACTPAGPPKTGPNHSLPPPHPTTPQTGVQRPRCGPAPNHSTTEKPRDHTRPRTRHRRPDPAHSPVRRGDDRDARRSRAPPRPGTHRRPAERARRLRFSLRPAVARPLRYSTG